MVILNNISTGNNRLVVTTATLVPAYENIGNPEDDIYACMDQSLENQLIQAEIQRWLTTHKVAEQHESGQIDLGKIYRKLVS